MSATIAIDPGLTGAAAFYDGTALLIRDLPVTREKNKTRLDIAALNDILLKWADYTTSALVEKVGSMPMQGLGSAFNFGFTTGAIHGVLCSLDVVVHTATPQQWKFGVGLNAVPGQTLKQRKDASRAKAIEIFPSYAGLFARAKDDGRAEAALMAWWFVHKRNAPQHEVTK